MAKIFETSDDIVELIEKQFSDTGLESYGLNLKIMSVPKAKDVIKVSRANATTEHLTKTNDLITVFVYEAAFDRLPDEAKEMITEMYLSGVSFDSEKDKITLDTNPIHLILNMRRKYGDDILNKIELAVLVIEEIEEEEKERKEAEKEAKRAKKNNK